MTYKLNSRDRIISILNLEEPDRVAVYDQYWSETIDRWKKEGLPEGVDCIKYFDLDNIAMISFDDSPRYEGTTYKETDRWSLRCGGYGSISRESLYSSKIQTRSEEASIQPAVKTLDDFKNRIEPFLDPNDTRRLCSQNSPFRKYLQKNINNLKKRHIVLASLRGPYVHCVSLCGIRNLLILFLRNPEHVKYMIDCYSKFISKASENLIDLGVDGLYLREDMAYKNGPFFSIGLYRNLIYNGHKKIFMTYRNRNLPVVLHCDGNFKSLIPDLISAGVSALEPLEVNSGMDVRELKEKHGDHLAFIGNIDKRMMSGNLDQVKNEVLSKLEYAAPGGGYILGSDHSVPPTVSLTNYTYMVKLVKKYGRYK